MSTRMPAVAGTFYPAEPGRLRHDVHQYLQAAQAHAGGAGAAPKAVIAPHAGYVYSGPVAASAYARLALRKGAVERVVLVGPSHRVWFDGLAVPASTAFATPLGSVEVDEQAVAALLALPQVTQMEGAHADEHSLEVQLPFLQETLGSFRLVPLAVGEASAEEVAQALEVVWGGAETAVVISTDLSHYQEYAVARRLDEGTALAMEARQGAIADDRACGARGVNGLLALARRRDLRLETLDLRSSGDTAGPRDGVVGYGAFAVYEPHA